ncbi:MAG: CidA/LrgA family protein [Lachnospiraceae bacterium]|nr:CidA/LrgA family protein [Lachnospiraceae bacterium]
MRFIKQFCIILLLSFLGELLHSLIPLPIPASVYGLVLMLAALCSGILKLHQVKEVSKFLIDIMPVMFIPAGVGLMNAWDTLRPMLFPVLAITCLTLVLVFGGTGIAAQFVIRRKGEREE